MLRNRSLLIWLIGTAQSQFGSALASIALSFLVLHQTGSARTMAVTLACSLLPQLLGPLAGAWVDRVNLRVPLVGADLLRGALQLALGGLALAWGTVPLWLINTIAVLNGVAGVVAMPAGQAAVPALVTEQELPQANGLIGSVSQAFWLIGSLAGGFLVAWLSPAFAIVLDGVSFLIMAGLLLLVRFPARSTPKRKAGEGVLNDVRAGLKLMARSRLLTMVPIIAFFINAATVEVQVIMPKLMDTLGHGAKGFGLYSALMSAGLLGAGLLFASFGQRLPLRRTSAAGLLLLGVAFGLMWLAPQYPVLLVCGGMAGFASGMINTPLFTLLQRHVPPAYLGRVFSVVMTSASIGMPLSLFALAPLLDRWPLPVWFAVGAVAMFLCTAALILVILSEREMPELLTRQQTM